jgi:hypothetical protein
MEQCGFIRELDWSVCLPELYITLGLGPGNLKQEAEPNQTFTLYVLGLCVLPKLPPICILKVLSHNLRLSRSGLAG